MKIIALVALVKLLDATDKPLLCSGLYAAVCLGVGLFSGNEIKEILLVTSLAFVVASVYFYFLDRVEGIFWWVILVIGLPMVMI